MISQDPDPVSPGDYVELRWMITNMGSKPLEGVEFKLVADYPFEFLGGETGIEKLGTIQGNQKGEEGIVLYYRVRINEDASEGVNDIHLMYRIGGADWVRLDSFEIRVQSVDAAIVIDDVRVEPAIIPPGNRGKVGIKVKNLADSVIKDVNINLDITLSSIPKPATITEIATLYDALPFAPVDSSTEKRIHLIKPGEVKLVSYDIMAYSSADSRIYKVPVIITYKDELDNNFTKTGVIGIIVGSEPDLYVVIDSSDLVAGQKYGKISFKFVNKGVTDIKFLDVALDETDDYKIVSAHKEYIGNIDSDDYDSVDFQLFLTNNGNPKKNSVLKFPLKITFKDANNKDYSESFELDYRINTAEEKGQSKSSSSTIIIIVIILMLLVWFVYRSWEKKRRKKLTE
jgi:hypothetical protein